MCICLSQISQTVSGFICHPNSRSSSKIMKRNNAKQFSCDSWLGISCMDVECNDENLFIPKQKPRTHVP